MTPLYSAAILTPRGRKDLLEWWETFVGPTLDTVIAHHMTIQFKPIVLESFPAQIQGVDLGMVTTLKIVGYKDDGKAQAVVVEGVNSSNTIAHVTVSVATGVKPVYSNTMLAQGYQRVNGPTLDVKVGFVGKDNRDYYSL